MKTRRDNEQAGLPVNSITKKRWLAHCWRISRTSAVGTEK